MGEAKTVYPSDFIKKNEVVGKDFTDKGEAIKFRDGLKKQGFETEWRRFQFPDLNGEVIYTITGIRERS